MGYILDTNIISETVKKAPESKVLQFVSAIDSRDLYLSVLTLGEIRKGVEKLTDQTRKYNITHWLENDLTRMFNGRIISINTAVADKWGYLCALRPLPVIDGLIAASAIVHNHKLVTRNTKDFQDIIGFELINPWEM